MDYIPIFHSTSLVEWIPLPHFEGKGGFDELTPEEAELVAEVRRETHRRHGGGLNCSSQGRKALRKLRSIWTGTLPLPCQRHYVLHAMENL